VRLLELGDALDGGLLLEGCGLGGRFGGVLEGRGCGCHYGASMGV